MPVDEGAYRNVDDRERQNASRPAHVEASQGSCLSILVEQDAGDEKPDRTKKRSTPSQP